jgi:hypothetical protein
MNTTEIAQTFTDLCRAGKFEEAGKRYWSENIVSVEPPEVGGAMARMQGRKALEDKGRWWSENNQVHSAKVEGPFVNGDEFALRFEFEVTPKGKSRTTMKEIGLYKVRDGRVVEERFYGVS